MALAISLQSLLIPAVLAARMHWPATIFTGTALAGLSMAAGFWVDQVFANPGFVATMGMLGLIFGLATALARSLWVALPAFGLVLIVNTLEEARYFDYPWWPILAGPVVTGAVLVWRWSVGEVEQVAGSAVQRRADGRERGEADGLGTVVLQDREIRQRHVDAL